MSQIIHSLLHTSHFVPYFFAPKNYFKGMLVAPIWLLQVFKREFSVLFQLIHLKGGERATTAGRNGCGCGCGWCRGGTGLCHWYGLRLRGGLAELGQRPKMTRCGSASGMRTNMAISENVDPHSNGESPCMTADAAIFACSCWLGTLRDFPHDLVVQAKYSIGHRLRLKGRH